MRPSQTITVIGIGLACLHVLVGLAIAFASIVPNAEGWLGGVFYIVMYAIPLVLVVLGARSRRRQFQLATGWAALFLALYLAAIPVGNWSGYSSRQAVFAVAVNGPTAIFYLAVSWTILRSSGRRRI